MKYALLIYENEAGYREDTTGDQMKAHIDPHMAFSAALGAKRIGGSGLKRVDSATTVRKAGGKVSVHDGPFAETKEQLGGFYIIEADDLDDAIRIAGQSSFS